MKSTATYPREFCYDNKAVRSAESRWWLLPHYLGIDAVVVAVIWQTIAAHFLHVQLERSEIATLALCVFSIYLGDRLRDSYSLSDRASLRHHFVSEYRGVLTVVFAIAVVLGGTVAALSLSRDVLFYGLLLCPVVLLYFIWTHLRGVFTERGWLKECAVGIVFSVGVFLSPVLKSSGITIPVFGMAAAFAVLCTLNCLTIGYHESRNESIRTYWIAAFLAVLLQVCFWIFFHDHQGYFAVLLLGTAFLSLLMWMRSSVKSDLAVLADIALVLAGLLTWVL